MKPAWFKGYAVLAGVFALGAVAGGGASYAYAQRRYAEIVAHQPRDFDGRRLHALARELDLSSKQRDEIRAIAERIRGERREVMEKCGAPIAEHRQKIDAEIRGVLTPDQQKRYDALLEKHRGRSPFGDRPRPGRRPRE